jgi:flagellar hook assembly protein FlgD
MLRGAMPNPFRLSSTLEYELSRASRVTLRIYDVSGRLVRSLVPGVMQEAGLHVIEWDGRNDAGDFILSGLYFARLDAGGEKDLKRLVRIR